MKSKKVTIFHNPSCGTSRNVLALLRERGIAPEVIEYLKTPPTREELTALVRQSGLGSRAFLRTRDKRYEELDLANPKWTDEELIGFVAENPGLLNRPVVRTAKGVKPCRPAESVLELLD